MPLKFQFRADEIEGRAHEIFNARLCGIGRDTHRLHPRQERGLSIQYHRYFLRTVSSEDQCLFDIGSLRGSRHEYSEAVFAGIDQRVSFVHVAYQFGFIQQNDQAFRDKIESALFQVLLQPKRPHSRLCRPVPSRSPAPSRLVPPCFPPGPDRRWRM